MEAANSVANVWSFSFPKVTAMTSYAVWIILLVAAIVTWVGAVVPPDQQPGGSRDPFTVSDVVAPGDTVNPPGTEDDDAVVPTATFGVFTGK